MLSRKVRVLVGDSDLCLGEATNRAAALIVLVLTQAERINQRGVRKIVVTQALDGLRLGINLRAAPLPDCAGMEPS